MAGNTTQFTCCDEPASSGVRILDKNALTGWEICNDMCIATLKRAQD